MNTKIILQRYFFITCIIASLLVSCEKSPICTLGAGDAFSVGLIAAALKGFSSEKQLYWGNANATSVVQKFGAQGGQLTSINAQI